MEMELGIFVEEDAESDESDPFFDLSLMEKEFFNPRHPSY
jgi:hypothetical protein